MQKNYIELTANNYLVFILHKYILHGLKLQERNIFCMEVQPILYQICKIFWILLFPYKTQISTFKLKKTETTLINYLLPNIFIEFVL